MATTRTKQESFSAGHAKIQARRRRRKIARRTLSDSFPRTRPGGDRQAEMESLCQRIEQTIRREAANTVQQLEAFFGIQHYFAHGTLLPSFHGWPISPDIGLYLIQLIEANGYDLVIEFGSGSSTFLMAKALEQTARRKTQEKPPLHVAFEHEETYFRSLVCCCYGDWHAFWMFQFWFLPRPNSRLRKWRLHPHQPCNGRAWRD